MPLPNVYFMLLLRFKRSIYSNRTVSTLGLKIGIYYNNIMYYNLYRKGPIQLACITMKYYAKTANENAYTFFTTLLKQKL